MTVEGIIEIANAFKNKDALTIVSEIPIRDSADDYVEEMQRWVEIMNKKRAEASNITHHE